MAKSVSMKRKTETIVISLGGSLICPREVDTKFLKTFIAMIKNYIKKSSSNRVIIITGGGFVCRQYNAAFDKIKKPNKNSTLSKDFVGIAMTKVNATLVQQLLINANIKTNPQLIVDPSVKTDLKKYKIAVGAGYKTGHSTDYDATLASIANHAAKIINLTNIDYVYTNDPRKFKDAKPLKDLSWTEYKKVLNIKKWESGLHTPFDPLASKIAEKKKLTVVIINGQKPKNLKSTFTSKPIGTTISSTRR